MDESNLALCVNFIKGIASKGVFSSKSWGGVHFSDSGTELFQRELQVMLPPKRGRNNSVLCVQGACPSEDCPLSMCRRTSRGRNVIEGNGFIRRVWTVDPPYHRRKLRSPVSLSR